jgi:hypothetical protein
MFWTLHRQHQQRGAQIPRPDEAPGEAVRGRAAQDHEQAAQSLSGSAPQPGESPASRIEDREGDNTPSAPDPQVDWDDVVQPERQPRGERFDRAPLPEGK